MVWFILEVFMKAVVISLWALVLFGVVSSCREMFHGLDAL
jgi:hypothetical protein